MGRKGFGLYNRKRGLPWRKTQGTKPQPLEQVVSSTGLSSSKSYRMEGQSESVVEGVWDQSMRYHRGSSGTEGTDVSNNSYGG